MLDLSDQTLFKVNLNEGNSDLLDRPGLSNTLKLMSRIAPQFILKQLGKPVDAMLAKGRPAAANG